MEIDEHNFKITGTSNIPESLSLDKRYLIRTEADCYSTKEKTNNDGTKNITYSLRQTGVAEILDDGKHIIKSKEKGTMSKKMHGRIYFYWNENYTNIEFDEFYEAIMKDLNFYLPDFLNMLKDIDGTFLNKLK